jgi:mannose-6-phosphate isomerase-like protein (cupin superfamily)
MLEKQNLKTLSDAISQLPKNFIISEVDQYCLIMAVTAGVYNWHHHPNADELFVVLEGELLIEFQDSPSIILKHGNTVTIPTRMVHRTSSKIRTVNLCFEMTTNKTIFV